MHDGTKCQRAARRNSTTFDLEEDAQRAEDVIWDEKQVAGYLKVAPKTLRQWRSQRTMLPFIKLGGKLVRYRRSDVEAFVNGHLRHSTSDVGER